MTEFAAGQIVQWGLVWPLESGEMAGYIVLPSEILKAQQHTPIVVPVKTEWDDDSMMQDSIPASANGGVVVTDSPYVSQTITTLNHDNGETWGVGPFLRAEMCPTWDLHVEMVQKSIIKYRNGLIQHPTQYDRNLKIESYIMNLLDVRIKRDSTGAKAPAELPRNLLATLNTEVVKADLDAMMRAGVIKGADVPTPDSTAHNSANAT